MEWRILPLLALTLTANMVLQARLAQADTGGERVSESAFIKMSFHSYRTVYANSNSSILIFNGADTNLPVYPTPLTAVIYCNIHQSTQFWFTAVDAWIGGVSWITQPLAADTTIKGNASMTVWMNTPDPVPFASGYAFGLTETDEAGNPIGGQFYQYKYNAGTILNQSPTVQTLAFSVNRTFSKGHILAFFVIVGSTTEGWRYQVYFDSPSMDSFIQLPILSAPIPEFSEVEMVTCMTLVTLCIFLFRRPR